MEHLTTAEAAVELGVSVRRVHALIKDNRLKAERFGGAWAIKRKDLDAVRDRKTGRPRKDDLPPKLSNNS